MTSRTDALTPTPRSRWALGLLMFLLGGCGLAYEYTLSKIASDLLGNSVQQWATMIATMLFAMGMGADFQKHTPADRLADRLISSQIALAVLGGFGPLIMIHGFALLPQLYIIIQYALAFTVGLLIGYEIPLVMRINEESEPDMRFNLAQVLKMDYVGALVGALLWTFLLVRYLSIERISFIVALATIASSVLCYFLYRRRLSGPRARVCEIAGATVLVTLGFVFGRGLTLRAEQFLYRDPIVTSLTTPFQHVVLTQNRSGNLRCYINGHLQFNEADEQIYHENLVHPAMHIAPRREKILILGGGDGLALREVLKYPEVREVTLVDLDPMMTDLATNDPHLVRMNGGSLSDPRVTRRAATGINPGVEYRAAQTSQYELFPTETHEIATLHVINLDAAEFVKTMDSGHDVVFMDFPDPNSPDLAKLYGRPFYDHLRNRLNPGAVIVQQSGGCFQAREAFLCIGRTLQAAGFNAVPYHDNVPSFGEWGWWIATMGRSAEQTRNALGGLGKLQVPTRYLTPELVSASLAFGKNDLFSNHQDFTSLTEPRVYHYHLQGWNIEETP
ncbi:polyamine aminopropyltransferase [Luteolibacter yonseiensis]|uniref:Polyamine aminopropyltransferase n=1 Tax=Luteolibacter yonseiensis TaxID=1144680 RepID=A0A934R7C8_9BACT|nr:polyamine aminopropyltransferase [Luteolibacter yonseiensis]MBK1817682.1 polyamine aminopropyltransferase [Luteolibacter yonseiensis]